MQPPHVDAYCTCRFITPFILRSRVLWFSLLMLGGWLAKVLSSADESCQWVVTFCWLWYALQDVHSVELYNKWSVLCLFPYCWIREAAHPGGSVAAGSPQLPGDHRQGFHYRDMSKRPHLRSACAYHVHVVTMLETCLHQEVMPTQGCLLSCI